MRIVATLPQKIITAFKLNCSPDTPVYLGDGNIEHMRESHYFDYARYGENISDILTSPDYVGMNPKNKSLDFVKEFITTDKEYVKVAVRVSQSGNFFARSLYVIDESKLVRFIAKGTLKKFDEI